MVVFSEKCLKWPVRSWPPGVKTKGHDPDALVETMYAGPKASLRPIYEEFVKLTRKLGKDVVVTPCKTYVGFRRKRGWKCRGWFL